jgi:5-methylcytosine-specific restriction endonuclease McrA
MLDSKICADCHSEYHAERYRLCGDNKYRCKPCGRSRRHTKWFAGKGKDTTKKYYDKHQQIIIARATKWNKENPERRSEITFKYWRTDKYRNGQKEKQRKKREEDPVWYKLKGVYGHYGVRTGLLKEIWDRDGSCQICGTEEELTFDHMHPRSRRGKSVPENIQILCRSCNSFKQARLLTPTPHAGVLIGESYATTTRNSLQNQKDQEGLPETGLP